MGDTLGYNLEISVNCESDTSDRVLLSIDDLAASFLMLREVA